MKRLYTLVFVLILLITGCSTETEHKGQNKMPNEMPSDFDFLVRYGYGEVNKNEMNTYVDTITKDLIVKGTATANLTFTTDEMRSIYEKMKEINIMGKKNLKPSKKGCSQTPYNEDNWKVTVDGKTETFAWSEKNCEVTDDAKQLKKLREFIWKMVVEKPVYKELPAAEGGYD